MLHDPTSGSRLPSLLYATSLMVEARDLASRVNQFSKLVVAPKTDVPRPLADFD